MAALPLPPHRSRYGSTAPPAVRWAVDFAGLDARPRALATLPADLALTRASTATFATSSTTTDSAAVDEACLARTTDWATSQGLLLRPASGGRAADRLVVTGADVLDGGRLCLEVTLLPAYAPTGYAYDPRLWTVDASNYCGIDHTTGRLVLVVGGVAWSPAAALAWTAGQLVTLRVDTGGAADVPSAAYAVAGGARVDLGTGTAVLGAVAAASLDVCCNGTSQCLEGYLRALRAFGDQSMPTYVLNPMTGALDAGGFKITNLADATAAQDAVNLETLQATDWKASVACATTANITLSGEQTLDGVTTSASRVLVKSQSTASQNGLYVSGAGAWARATDADTSAKVTSCLAVMVEQGTTLGGTCWRLSTTGAITLGSTSLTFAQFGGGTVTNPMTADLDTGGYRVKSLAYPAADADAARRVDRGWLQPVRLARTTALPANTYSSTGNGSLTATANGALTVDTVTPSVGDAVAVQAEATGANNGIYTVTQVGDGTHPYILTRRADFAHGAAIPAGLLCFVTDGSTADSLNAAFKIGPVGTVGSTSVTLSAPLVRSPLLANLDANGKQITGGQIGSSSTRTTYDGATKVLSTTKSANFTAEPTVPRYRLSADTLTITLNEATWTVGDVVTFTSVTETTSPGHTFACSSAGKFKFAGSGGGGSGVTTAPWPSGATIVVIECDASGVFIRS